MVYTFERIPQELRECPQWVCWRYMQVGDKEPTKIPINPKNGKAASSTDPETWGTYEICLNFYANNGSNTHGIGFVFCDNSGYAGIDIDGKERTAEELAAQVKLVERFDSYTEYSPSGNGVHVIIKGSIPKGVRRHGVEAYSSGRYFTFTGNVYLDRPIAQRQALLDILTKELAPTRGNNRGVFAPDYPQIDSDEIILHRIMSASNGDKAMRLAGGDTSALPGNDRSGSAVDMALVNIIQFYTQNTAQIERLWLGTYHAQQPSRARKMARTDYRLGTIQRAFDQTAAPIDIDVVVAGAARNLHAANATLGNDNGGAPHPAPARRKVNRYKIPVNPYTPPPGLIGDIAKFIHAQAPKPVAEIALAGAIAWLAGVAGKAYNVSGEGLNLYIASLASSGTGKEAVSRGYGKIQAALTAYGVDAIANFMGPGDFASVPGLLKSLTEKRSCVSIITEFGGWLSQMLGERAAPVRKAIKTSLLALYSKSGRGAEYYETVYADKANSIAKLDAPALTIYGESTATTFYANITQNVIEDGFLPRFIIMEYTGTAPKLNRHAHSVNVPDMLQLQLAEFVTQCVMLNSLAPSPVKSTRMSDLVRPLVGPKDVGFADECVASIYAFNDYCTDQANDTEIEGIKNLWSRVWMNTVKLAALAAVGRDYNNPYISTADFDWARGIVLHSMYKIVDRVDSGEIASDAETKQWNDLLRCLAELPTYRVDRAEAYGITMGMARDGVINTMWLGARVSRLAAYKDDRFGAAAALKRSTQRAIDEGLLVLTNAYVTGIAGGGRVFVINRQLLSQYSARDM